MLLTLKTEVHENTKIREFYFDCWPGYHQNIRQKEFQSWFWQFCAAAVQVCHSLQMISIRTASIWRGKKNHVIVLVAECSRGLFQVPWSMKSSSSAGTSLHLFVCKVLPVWISMSIFLPSIYLSDDIDQTKRYMILLKMCFSSLQAWEFCRCTKTIEWPYKVRTVAHLLSHTGNSGCPCQRTRTVQAHDGTASEWSLQVLSQWFATHFLPELVAVHFCLIAINGFLYSESFWFAFEPSCALSYGSILWPDIPNLNCIYEVTLSLNLCNSNLLISFDTPLLLCLKKQQTVILYLISLCCSWFYRLCIISHGFPNWKISVSLIIPFIKGLISLLLFCFCCTLWDGKWKPTQYSGYNCMDLQWHAVCSVLLYNSCWYWFAFLITADCYAECNSLCLWLY